MEVLDRACRYLQPLGKLPLRQDLVGIQRDHLVRCHAGTWRRFAEKDFGFGTIWRNASMTLPSDGKRGSDRADEDCHASFRAVGRIAGNGCVSFRADRVADGVPASQASPSAQDAARGTS